MADEKKPKAAPAVSIAADAHRRPLPADTAPKSAAVAEATPADRLAFAVEGKPARSYAEVYAADVVAVASTVPAGRHTPTTAALEKGARAALAESATPAELTVYQAAGQVAELLEAAADNAQPV